MGVPAFRPFRLTGRLAMGKDNALKRRKSASSSRRSGGKDPFGPEHAGLDRADRDEPAMRRDTGLCRLDRSVAATQDDWISRADTTGRIVADFHLRKAIERRHRVD